MARGAAQDLVAVVGMDGRLPGARDLEAFWRLMIDRVDAIVPVPVERWDGDAQLDPEKSVQSVGGFLEGLDQFDPVFFGISPREAEDVDPQQRLMLEASFGALEDAGQALDKLRGRRVGVYVGAAWHDYELLRKQRGGETTAHSLVGGALDVIAARVSYFFGFGGPSLTVETGCSSSLVALHLACQALKQGEIEGAIVGGVNLMLVPDGSIGLTHFGGLSPRGRCQAFAATADGFVRGEGAIALYVKTLAAALRDGDPIRGVVVHTEVNNDGGGDSLVTPFARGQEELLRRAYEESGVQCDQLAYVEAHGTGTPRGDPIEAAALGRVLGRARSAQRGPLAIGSVKTNIGHLEACSGLAGVVKAVLSLEHRMVPPSLHAEALRPEIAFDELNLRVLREPLALPAEGDVHIGVNSFGWGGTNAHAILRNGPRSERAQLPALTGPVLVPLSAHNQQALADCARDLVGVLDRESCSWEALAASLARRRAQHTQRAALLAASREELRELLCRFVADPHALEGEVVQGRAANCGRIAFVFPGQGSQWAAMGQELFAHSPRFAEVIVRCAAALRPWVSWDLLAFVSGAAGDRWLDGIDTLQPTLWAVSVALAELWREAGVEPDLVIGHSMGEVAAATVAGILSYEDAARVIARRSAIANCKSGQGRMLAVSLDLDAARAALAGFEDRVSLAVHNGPSACVLSGDSAAVEMLQELLEADGVDCRMVRVDFASHSHQMDEFKAELLASLAPVQPRAGTTPLMSTVRACELNGSELDAAYWVANLREPVLFGDAIAKAFDAGVTHVIEVSPHPILVPALEELAALREDAPRVLATLYRDQGTPHDLQRAYARAYVSGLAPLAAHSDQPGVVLPAYPFQRRSYWLPLHKRQGAPNRGFQVRLTPAPSEPDAWQAGLELGIRDNPWLADHRVCDAVVLPATAMLALALAAARARTGALPEVLLGVRFHAPLPLGNEAMRLQISWRDEFGVAGSFSLLSLDEAAAHWTEHASARSVRAQNDQHAAAFPAHMKEATALSGAEFYQLCAARGLHYGPAFQGLQRIFVQGDRALAELCLPQACAASLRAYAPLHPALWDAALQVVLPLCPAEHTFVPSSISRVRLLAALEAPLTSLWSYAVRHDDGSFELILYGSDERLLMGIEGLTLAQLARAPSAAIDEAHVHTLSFAEAPRVSACAAGGSFVVCGRAEDGVDAITDAMRACGTSSLRLYSPQAGALSDTHSRLAQELKERLHNTTDPANVVFLAPRSHENGAVARGLWELTTLVRACAALAMAPRLTVVTALAQRVQVGERPSPDAASYWGFARVLRREHPELAATALDIDPREEGWAALCAAELISARGSGQHDDQVALRRGRRFVAQIVRGRQDDEERSRPAWRSPAQPFRLVAPEVGGFEGLAYRPLARRSPARDEVEVEVSAAGLNFVDVMKVMGIYPGLAGQTAKLGGECVGRVVRVGSAVTELRTGDRVAACALGALSSHLTLRADHAQPVPEHLSDVQAAGLPLVMTTAWYALHDLARLTPGETVLIHSAAGGLGLAAIQVAQLLGGRVLASAGSAEKRRYLRELGVEHVFDSRDGSWAEGVLAATRGVGVNVVLNSLTGAALEFGLTVLAEDGCFIELGKKDIYGGRRLSLAAFKKGIRFAAVDLAGLIGRRPERFAQLFADVWRRVASSQLTPLPTSPYAFADAADALRALAPGDHIGKFVLSAPESVCEVAPEPLPEGRFRADATYVISGGLGALGLSLAAFMIERGASSLLLLGRSAPGSELKQRIAQLDAEVETETVDVSDREALAACLDRARARRPVRGVIHAAGLLDDAIIDNLTAQQLGRVLAPKVEGARNLDLLTRADCLDFFVLFSSAAALLGNVGQAAYAAGNAFMDGLAEARRAEGLPALSVQWGVFAEIGLAAQDERRGARLAARGMGSITTAEAWPALVQLLHTDAAVVGYVPLALREWFEAYPDTAALRSWQALRSPARDGIVREADGEFMARLRQGQLSERLLLAEAKVRELTGRVLRIDPHAIESDTPFKALGLDSLMGLELRNRLESTFGLRLSPTLLWTYGNARDLASVLCERVSELARA